MPFSSTLNIKTKIMLGAIIGDVIGSAYERNNVKTTEFELLAPNARFTDDTVMTLAVARWLMEAPLHSTDSLVRIMQEMGRKYPDAGYGGSFYNWIFSENPRPYNSWGNGSAMRVSPVGLFANCIEEALRLAEVSAAVTHNHPEGIKGAQAIAACVYYNRTLSCSLTDRKKFIKDYVERTFGYNLHRTLDEIRPHYRFDVSCQGSVPEAIIAFLEADSLEDCARKAVSIGGDSDTIAAMACSIFAAGVERLSPFSTQIYNRCLGYLNDELRLIVERFDSICCTSQCYFPRAITVDDMQAVPSLSEGENIRGRYRDNIPYWFVIKGVLFQTHDEIVYAALENECYDLGGRWHPIEIVEIIRNEVLGYPQRDALSIVFGDRDSAIYPRYIEHNCKIYFIRDKYESCKLKSGVHILLHGADYEILQTIGCGSYGEVLKLQCKSRSVGNKVRKMLHFSQKDSDVLAVKQFSMNPVNLPKDPDATALQGGELTAKVHFKRGYDAMTGLSHPNIVEVYDYFIRGDIPCFTMEYIDGCNLRQYVSRNGCLSEAEARAIIVTICRAIRYCHEKGVYHGDLKPNNVMITHDGSIKIIDFCGCHHYSDIKGLAKVYLYLLTGIYVSPSGKTFHEDMERIAVLLDEKKISDVVKSQILFMFSSPRELDDKRVLQSVEEAVEDHQLLTNTYVRTSHQSLSFQQFAETQPKTDIGIFFGKEFTTFEKGGLYGMKNKQDIIVIPPLYSSISSIGSHHIPGPGPTSGWDIVGVMTYRDGLTGWYELVDGNQMKLVIELTEEQIGKCKMMT